MEPLQIDLLPATDLGVQTTTIIPGQVLEVFYRLIYTLPDRSGELPLEEPSNENGSGTTAPEPPVEASQPARAGTDMHPHNRAGERENQSPDSDAFDGREAVAVSTKAPPDEQPTGALRSAA